MFLPTPEGGASIEWVKKSNDMAFLKALMDRERAPNIGSSTTNAALKQTVLFRIIRIH